MSDDDVGMIVTATMTRTATVDCCVTTDC